MCLFPGVVSHQVSKYSDSLFWGVPCRGVLLGKTVVLATNQLQFVASADTVLYIAGGRILEAGTYADLLLAGGPFAAMMKEAQVRVCAVLAGSFSPHTLSDMETKRCTITDPDTQRVAHHAIRGLPRQSFARGPALRMLLASQSHRFTRQGCMSGVAPSL